MQTVVLGSLWLLLFHYNFSAVNEIIYMTSFYCNILNGFVDKSYTWVIVHNILLI